MKKYFEVDEWQVIENDFDKNYNRVTESVMSLGNGHMGLRGNFAENYTGDSLQGTYIAGVYYPDKTIVGWWKNGYPEYFAKIANAANFIGINLQIDGTEIDLNKVDFSNFKRVLNMKKAFLERSFTVELENNRVEIIEKRFLNQKNKELAAVKYQVRPLAQDAEIVLIPHLDGDVKNEDANYNEFFWEGLKKKNNKGKALLSMKTRKSDFVVATAMNWDLNKKERKVELLTGPGDENYVGNKITLKAAAGEKIELNKYIAVCTSRDYEENLVSKKAEKKAAAAEFRGYEDLFTEHKEAWAKIWQESDIKIKGDPEAQQGIRFNIFHLNQTYTGHDPRLNIGPKGFTGEKYGGLTYWDTEAYCLPFYLATHSEDVSRNLLLYRYNHLEKAVENADKLGLDGALYPMVTINGEECHNEWEITFEEIHRNGAIAHAVKDYVDYTGDEEYIKEYGIPVLAQISRFWADRAHFNSHKDKYMILGVTGPNEYENNVNNNWYTNRIAVWTLNYTLENLEQIKKNDPAKYEEWISELELEDSELELWQDMTEKMYYPYLEEFDVYSQQDGYLDKEQKLVSDLEEEDIPLHKNWSWDKILRSPYIKQADVLQGIYYFKEDFDRASIARHYDFYEPRTVHESSLSPCIYSLLAADLEREEKAYQLYLRTARLDLDNYNTDTDDGLHITSMAGTWMSIVKGFAGFKVQNDQVEFRPFLPEAWDGFNFMIIFRGRRIKVNVEQEETTFYLEAGADLKIKVYGQDYLLNQKEELVVEK
ncbi:maltose phosphorylase [Halanaerobium congolense]|uniref:Maltose phosphorylase n=1 Tax=Halanaerobium congolense TaxID=54121 RepID=A0A1G6JM89_9FIRM|nr:family 65 glycosyl hydrolase domain-containing protein [Halanaerobium congolense]PTX16207.1 maltose phosphorylase [Halanaerobium congolense]PXV60143.1 maltose phosphorylase [Halanaerobium congolense]TDS31578.1 maltose phosphorylase [Halanaerobium congolense]SDC19086.1 maltose phosphorylase [Halanaerobium congolense]SDF48496.1 maltose phosphorylase [Halanaerobium congolense]